MYFHMRLNSQWPMLGCQIESPEGEKNYFFFKVMRHQVPGKSGHEVDQTNGEEGSKDGDNDVDHDR